MGILGAFKSDEAGADEERMRSEKAAVFGHFRDNVVCFYGNLAEYERYKGTTCEILGPQVTFPQYHDFNVTPEHVRLANDGIEAIINCRKELVERSDGSVGGSTVQDFCSVGLPVRRVPKSSKGSMDRDAKQ